MRLCLGVRMNDLVVTSQGAMFCGEHFPCTIGRAGVTVAKCEGDMATPRGAHPIIAVLYRADRVLPPLAWAQPTGPQDGWSDDPDDPDYNRSVRLPHPFGHERLWRPDPLYDVILVTGWNQPDRRAGGGSAIFVHQWRNRCVPTAGCVALRRDHLHRIARRLTPSSRLVVR